MVSMPVPAISLLQGICIKFKLNWTCSPGLYTHSHQHGQCRAKLHLAPMRAERWGFTSTASPVVRSINTLWSSTCPSAMKEELGWCQGRGTAQSLQWERARQTLGAASSCSEECAEDSHAEYRRRNNNHVRGIKSKKFCKEK